MQAVCMIKDCSSPALARGWCSKHYNRWRAHGDPLFAKNAYNKRIGKCKADGCLRDILAQGLCSMHYQRWMKHGDPNVTLIILRDDWTRFWSKVSGDDALDCWEWTGQRKKDPDYPYGVFWVGGRRFNAHRVAWEYLRGEIPLDCRTGLYLTLDHTCSNPPCCNPWHLDPVPIGVNTWRGGVKRPRRSDRVRRPVRPGHDSLEVT